MNLLKNNYVLNNHVHLIPDFTVYQLVYDVT